VGFELAGNSLAGVIPELGRQWRFFRFCNSGGLPPRFRLESEAVGDVHFLGLHKSFLSA